MDLGSQFHVGTCSEVSFVLVGRFFFVTGFHSDPGDGSSCSDKKKKSVGDCIISELSVIL